MGNIFTSLILFCGLSLWGDLSKKTFSFSLEPIDVVIACHPKDLRTLPLCLQGIKQHGTYLRRFIVISKERLTQEAEWFSEDLFPFSKEDIAKEIFHGDDKAAHEWLQDPTCRIGWIYQQFLKLYAPFVIPNISSNVLMLDADVVFLQPISFMNEQGEPYLTGMDEYHSPYFEHGKRLLPGWHRVYERFSGIAHHMLFQKPLLEDLFATIQAVHSVEPWVAFCRVIDPSELHFACMSEYEIYFNYALLRTSQTKVRTVKWTYFPSLRGLPHLRKQGYTFVCFPTWLSSY